MRKYYTFFSYAFILILIYLTQNLGAFSQNRSESEKEKQEKTPLHKCWDLNIEGTGKAAVASDNTNQIYLSAEAGTIIAVDLKDGTQDWKTELGGETLQILSGEENLYILSVNTDAEKTLNIRSISSGTGIVKWQKTLAISGNNTKKRNNSLTSEGEFLFLATSPGNLYKISKDGGQEAEKISLSEPVSTPAVVFNRKVYVGTENRHLNIYSITDKTVTKIPLKEIPTAIFAAEDKIIVGDRSGGLVSYDTEKNKRKWQTRVGAEIADVARTKEGFAISSNDNFIYLISPGNGEKIWKKRFAGRTAVSTINEESLITANLNGSLSTLLEARTGKTIDQVSLPSPNFFIGKPFSINGTIVFQTNTGLVAYSSINCAKKERPEVNSGLKLSFW